MPQIISSVGRNGANQKGDVRSVQDLLNRYSTRLGIAPLRVDGVAGARTVSAIERFQRQVLGMAAPDGRVDPGALTWNKLVATSAPSLSGAAWWHANQARFPNSRDIEDLDATFKPKVKRFLAAMKEAGINYEVNSTRRSKIRAYLMHYSWMIAKGNVAPEAVPIEPGCDIVWDHGNASASKVAAQQMVGLFGLVFKPSLNSRHIPGLAIDMDIAWTGTAKVKDASGSVVSIGSPCDDSNTKLHTVGASYGVVKNLKDPPHWSDTGG